MKRNEGLLLFGTITTKIGDVVFDYINNVVLVQNFASKPWILALYQSSETIVNIMLNLIGGAVSDIRDRKKLVIISDSLSALVCLAAGCFVKSSVIAAVLISANALLAVVFSFSSPAFKSIIKDMIEEKRISWFNSISNALQEIIAITGPLLALLVMNVVGAQGALFVTSCTFFISVISEMLLKKIKSPMSENSLSFDESGEDENENIFAEIKNGISYLLRKKQILFLVIISAFVNFFLAGYNLLLPYTDIIYEVNFENFYGKVITTEAIGALVGSIINSLLSGKITNSKNVLMMMLGGTGASLVLAYAVSASSMYILCLMPFALFGALLSMYNINFMSYVQVNVDDKYLGRVFSVIFTVAVMFMPIGSFFFSFVDITNNASGFGIVGAGIVILAIVGVIIGISRGKQ